MAGEVIIKTQTELEEEVRTELVSTGFSITNWSIGSRFRRLIAAVLRPTSELYQLMSDMIPQMYYKTASDGWLRLKGSDEGVDAFLAQKALGKVLMGRNEITAVAVMIPSGTIVKTELDGKGNEYRFISQSDVLLPSGSKEILVPVEAESEGASYNVGSGKINVILTHVEGIDYVNNTTDWLTNLGTDDEDDESYRSRIGFEKKLRRGEADALYRALAMSVPGVKDAIPIMDHPRGQGTIDIAIITDSGIVPSEMLALVQAAVNAGKEVCADVLVKVAGTQTVDVNLTLVVDRSINDLAPYQAAALSVVDSAFASLTLEKSAFILGEQTKQLMGIENAKDVIFTTPTASVTPPKSVRLIKGTVTINVIREA